MNNHLVKVYGITTCATVKKALKWLRDKNIEFDFIDVRKVGLTERQLKSWAQEFDWGKLVNKNSKAWRELSAEDKAGLTKEKSIKLILANPTLMKRPVVEAGETRLLGFKVLEYENSLLNGE